MLRQLASYIISPFYNVDQLWYLTVQVKRILVITTLISWKVLGKANMTICIPSDFVLYGGCIKLLK